MAQTNPHNPKFEPPGPGPWEIETTHMSRPGTLTGTWALTKGFSRGFKEVTARYGLMLDHLKPAAVNGFMYMQPVAFGAPEGANGPPPKLIIMLLTRLLPKMRARIKQAKTAMQSKLW